MDWRSKEPDKPVSSANCMNLARTRLGYGYDSFPNSSMYPSNSSMCPVYTGHNYEGNDASHSENYYNPPPEGSHQSCYLGNIPQNYNQGRNPLNSYVGYSPQNYYTHYHMQDPTKFQVPYVPLPAAPRVHINPNYRPKLLSGTDDICVSRSTNVHINPHWKGPAKQITTSQLAVPNVNCGKEGSSKNTIFVNPKVLARIKMDPMTVLNEEHSPRSVENPRSSCKTMMRKTPIPSVPDLDTGSGKDFTLSNFFQNPVSFAQSSAKLALNASTTPQHKEAVVMQDLGQKSQHSYSQYETVANQKSSHTPSFKIAKQVSSKYRLVRNLQSAVKTKSVAASSPRRFRRKSVNSKLLLTSRFNSVYKFVRKPSIQELPSNKIVNRISSSHQGNTMSPGRGILKRSVRTRYKLIKTQSIPQRDIVSCPENKRAKLMQSKYKLVCKNNSELKSQHKKLKSSLRQASSESGFLQYPSYSRSRFKITRNAVGTEVIHERSVSQSRIVCVSNFTRFRSKLHWRHRKSPASLSLSYIGMKNPGFYGNKIWQKGKSLCSSTLQTEHHAQLSCVKKSNRKLKNMAIPARNSSNKSLLNISGVLYRSTPTSLTRTHPGELKERVVCICGSKFVLDGKGTILRPTFGQGSTDQSKPECKEGPFIARVDIGGVTFTRRSDNTLVRTNFHHTRNLLSIAKMRSIALLTHKLRKNNQPCLIYHRFGRCQAFKDGKCWRLHDPKNIAVCKKFLQGCCKAEDCLLSHNVGPEKMPTCRYFLGGCCVRDNCPYLHVKLSAHAAICRQFLDGYCEAGDKCKKRHVNLCPNFEQQGKCSKGKYCPFPHRSQDNKEKSKKEQINISANPKKKFNKCDEENRNTIASVEGDKRKRYYDGSTSEEGRCSSQIILGDLNMETSASQTDVLESEEFEDIHECPLAQRRGKIGKLPAYIPLE